MRADDQKQLFLNWLGEHGAAVMKVARAYTLTSEECQDLAQEILLQAWRSLPNFGQRASAATVVCCKVIENAPRASSCIPPDCRESMSMSMPR